MYERVSDRQLPNIRNMMAIAAKTNYPIGGTKHVQEVLKDFDEWIALVRREAVIEFVQEQNAEHRKTLGKIMYAVIDEV